jgi:hypothetical protein
MDYLTGSGWSLVDEDGRTPQAFGRRLANRMTAAAMNAQLLADAVNAGDQPLRSFGTSTREAANATELEALSGLGGSERNPYQLRFAQTPLAPQSKSAVVLQVTPGQQRGTVRRFYLELDEKGYNEAYEEVPQGS